MKKMTISICLISITFLIGVSIASASDFLVACTNNNETKTRLVDEESDCGNNEYARVFSPIYVAEVDELARITDQTFTARSFDKKIVSCGLTDGDNRGVPTEWIDKSSIVVDCSPYGIGYLDTTRPRDLVAYCEDDIPAAKLQIKCTIDVEIQSLAKPKPDPK